MRNKYGGTCYECGHYVEPGKGHFERHRGGWRVKHVSCTLIKRDGRNPRIAKIIENKIPKSFEEAKR